METSLHRQLKHIYAGEQAATEVSVDRYRIDAVRNDVLYEIQHGSLSAIRNKIHHLVNDHQIVVVKPLIANKTIVKQDARGGTVVSRRRSPKRAEFVQVFDELVYFTNIFPHPNLKLEVPLVTIEELRYPGHGRRRRWRRNDFQIEDQRLLNIESTVSVRSPSDLRQALDLKIRSPFNTHQLATALGVKRHVAQRVAYCFREMGATEQVGKQGNALLYRFTRRRAARQRN